MTRGSPAQTLALQLRRIPALRMCTRALPPRFRRTHRVWGLVGPSPPLFPRSPITPHLPLRRRLYPWGTPVPPIALAFNALVHDSSVSPLPSLPTPSAPPAPVLLHPVYTASLSTPSAPPTTCAGQRHRSVCGAQRQPQVQPVERRRARGAADGLGRAGRRNRRARLTESRGTIDRVAGQSRAAAECGLPLA